MLIGIYMKYTIFIEGIYLDTFCVACIFHFLIEKVKIKW
jgi:hypothetical protein